MNLENIVIICVIIYFGLTGLATLGIVVLETLTFLATAVLDLVSELINNIKKRSKERGEDD